MSKEAKCKGINKAFGFEGCGTNSNKRKFGLCPSCLWDWMKNDDRGIKWKSDQFNPKVTQKMASNKRKEKKDKKIESMSNDKYRKTYVQPLINKIARLIDYGNPCVATGDFGKENGGHYTSVGANRTICLNLHNIFIQSFQSNHWQSGDNAKYRQGIMRIFGEDYLDYVEGLRRHKPIKLSKSDLIRVKKEAQKICVELSRENKVRNPLQRIRLRNEMNIRIGIYDKEFCEFEIK